MYLNCNTDEGILMLCTLSQLVHRYTNDSVTPSHPNSLTQLIPHDHAQSLVSTRELRGQCTF